MQQLMRRPEFITDLLQILKSVTAGTAAWWLSANVLDSSLPFLAPWTALLTVHATVYRSLSRGAQTTVASAIGVGVSLLIGVYLGVGVWTFALALFVGLAGARVSWIRDEGVAIATTSIFVLGSGFSSQQPLLLDRLIEVGLGVAVGIAVNLLVVPPLRDQQAARYVDSINRRMGNVLIDMADEFSASWDTDKAEAWFSESESMSEELNSAWQSVRFAKESRWANPRGRLTPPRGAGNRQPQTGVQNPGFEEILPRVDEGISHLRHLARTLREATYSSGEWDTRFREQWVAIVRDSGRAIADPDAAVEPIYDRLSKLASDMATDQDLPHTTWPLYGSLIASMRHIVVIVDDVASAREARQSTAATS
ncbi:FUSC family protein [Arthrobacter pigmenti]